MYLVIDLKRRSNYTSLLLIDTRWRDHIRAVALVLDEKLLELRVVKVHLIVVFVDFFPDALLAEIRRAWRKLLPVEALDRF
jgi:hypothetical protein